MRTEELNFELPEELIAQEPPAERTDSRLLLYRRDKKTIAHQKFTDLPRLLKKGDLLVFNNSRVVPARIMLRKQSGGKVEGLFLKEETQGEWLVMLKNLGSLRAETQLHFADAADLRVTVLDKMDGGVYRVHVESHDSAHDLLGKLGRMPLPPYIKRGKEHDARDAQDAVRYQTVYAKTPGSVAAPTAGLHFTEALLKELRAAGIGEAFITLDVGLGTFKPINTELLADHQMHSERYVIDTKSADLLNKAKKDKQRIIPVGTTSARVLESVDQKQFAPKKGETELFIYPPYTWKHASGLLTNFHLPKSSLIALVAAMVGLEEQRKIYKTAIEQKYRFFSYGDAMLAL